MKTSRHHPARGLLSRARERIFGRRPKDPRKRTIIEPDPCSDHFL